MASANLSSSPSIANSAKSSGLNALRIFSFISCAHTTHNFTLANSPSSAPVLKSPNQQEMLGPKHKSHPILQLASANRSILTSITISSCMAELSSHSPQRSSISAYCLCTGGGSLHWTALCTRGHSAQDSILHRKGLRFGQHSAPKSSQESTCAAASRSWSRLTACGVISTACCCGSVRPTSASLAPLSSAYSLRIVCTHQHSDMLRTSCHLRHHPSCADYC